MQLSNPDINRSGFAMGVDFSIPMMEPDEVVDLSLPEPDIANVMIDDMDERIDHSMNQLQDEFRVPSMRIHVSPSPEPMPMPPPAADAAPEPPFIPHQAEEQERVEIQRQAWIPEADEKPEPPSGASAVVFSEPDAAAQATAPSHEQSSPVAGSYYDGPVNMPEPRIYAEEPVPAQDYAPRPTAEATQPEAKAGALDLLPAASSAADQPAPMEPAATAKAEGPAPAAPKTEEAGSTRHAPEDAPVVKLTDKANTLDGAEQTSIGTTENRRRSQEEGYGAGEGAFTGVYRFRGKRYTLAGTAKAYWYHNEATSSGAWSDGPMPDPFPEKQYWRETATCGYMPHIQC